MHIKPIIKVIASVVVLAGCQTTGNGETTYNFLYTPADHMMEMVEVNNLTRADFIYRSQRDFFDGPGADEASKEENATTGSKSEVPEASEAEQAIDAFVKAIDAEHRAEIEDAIGKIKKWQEWPVERGSWPSVADAVESAKNAMQSYKRYRVLDDESRLPNTFVMLDTETKKLRSAIISTTISEFKKYDLTKGKPFFETYPVADNFSKFLEKNRGLLETKITAFDLRQLEGFSRSYEKWISNSVRDQLGKLYFEKALGKNTKPDFQMLMTAINKTKTAGFDVSEIPGVNVAAIEVTSKTLLEQGQIEFPIAIKNDLPFEMRQETLDNAFKSPLAKKADVLVLIDVAAARNNRKITNTNPVASEFQSGTRTVANPAYNQAQNAVNNARLEVQRAAMNSASVNSQYCYGMACLGKALGQIAAAAGEARAQEKLQQAMADLQRTPMQLSKPVYTKYNFRKVEMDASKEATVNFYVIDRMKRRYVKSDFDAVETKNFKVAYNLHGEDRNKSRHLSQSDSESDVLKFEENGISVNLSDILSQYSALSRKSKNLPSLTSIRKEVLADKNKALVEFKKNKFEVTPDKNDPRFDSVVVVYHPGGGLGTGFFVRDDLILTNFHVIEGSQFVEMKLFNGQETFGKVIASDVRLDLALIKSQARGKPVNFYQTNNLPQGKTVEVIGHPRGLEFSITRGIVSSLREINSRYMPGGRKVRFIQTDAAINPGNSGGPMFLGRYVVGVNTQKLAATELEGLSFAVHYADVLQFLKENNIGAGS